MTRRQPESARVHPYSERPAFRAVAVDGLRTAAVGLVVLTHLLPDRVPGGSIGVDLFFVISGFVITTTLLREHAATGRLDLGAFYTRRAVRLTPALFTVAGTVLVLALLLPGSPPFGGEWVGALLSMGYVMDLARGLDWSNGDNFHLLGHTWSLGIEEQFYLVWPLVLLVLWRLRNKVALACWAVLLLAPALVRTLIWSPSLDYRLYNMPDARADQLLVGAALAAALTVLPEARVLATARALVWPSIAMLGAVALLVHTGVGAGAASTVYYTVGFLLVALAGAVVVSVLVLDADHPLTRVLAWNPVQLVGRRYSYGLYLWHYVVFNVVTESTLTGVARPLTKVVVTAALVYGTHRFVETPVQQWYRHRRRATANRP